MKTSTFLIALALLWAGSSTAQTLSKKLQEQLDAAELEMFAATSNGDSAAFRKICGPDYFTINSSGNAQTLEEALPFVKMFKGSTVSLSQQMQRVYGDFAVRTGLGKAYINGQLVAEFLYTGGWVYRDKKWQFVHWQGTATGILLQGKGMMEPPKKE
ncbi:MAG TPA: nuclear transport factor 2 family protein [Phnomibacter sp.]|nr:nuclear transport factor 2 family protein [Phnomibacter sp.]